MERDIRKSEQAGQEEKKPYEAPALTNLGQVEELTMGGGGPGTDAGTST